MFALHLLSFSPVFSAFTLAFFVAVDRLTFNRSTASLLLAVVQDESAAKLSAFILDNQPSHIETSDLEYLGGDYDVTETPGESCLFDALEMLASFLANEATAEKAVETPVIQAVQVKAFTIEDVEIQRAWNGYRRYAAFAADFSPVIRPEARYVASEKAAFEAEIDTSYVDWAMSTG